jgi:hypothetical protein
MTARPGRIGGLALLALLAGCAGVGFERNAVARSSVSFVPDQSGLAVAGSPRRIDFGRAPSGVISVLDRELGTGNALGLAGCPAGIKAQRDWGGLVLTFTDEQFVGWRQAGAQAGLVCSAA